MRNEKIGKAVGNGGERPTLVTSGKGKGKPGDGEPDAGTRGGGGGGGHKPR